MALGVTGIALVYSFDNDHLETNQLKLTAANFPLSRSVGRLVLEKFADPARSGSGSNVMAEAELRGYIRSISDVNSQPLEAILAQTEVIGDPALPTPEQVAVLRWLGKALQTWESTFPLEEPLRARIRELKPLLATSAISEASFCVPGAHPLHQVLDNLQELAVGWEPSLGRAGKPAETLLNKTVDDALKYFDSGKPSLQKLASELAESSAKIRQRNERMAQRATESERGKFRTARAKSLAANRINRALAQFQAPTSLGTFITGPWYESAQLVILKFGENSEQWREMAVATDDLMRSLQPSPEGSDDNPQLRSEQAAKASIDLRKWLLSLQHDGQTIEQAISEIEYAHLRLARKQPLELDYIPLIPLIETPSLGPAANGPSPLPQGLEPGQLFRISSPNGNSPNGNSPGGNSQSGDPRRVQLVMMLEAEQLLLFCNQAGIKAAPLSYQDFATLLTQGRAKLLHTGATFSRVLAGIVGINSTATLEEFSGPAISPEKPDERDSPQSTEPAAADNETSLPALELSEDGSAKMPELPMGSWLGFHDLDPPLLAKLALHDEVKKILIFVNRKGLELRRLDEKQYLALIEQDLIDIMETTNSFREQVENARQRMKKQ